MKKMNKTTVLMPVLGVFAITALATGTVAAQSSDEQISIADKIAQRFSLDAGEVQTVFDDHKTEKKAERSVAREAKLDELVAAGTLTTEQKTELVAMKDAMQAQKQTLKDSDLTREEIRTQMEASKTEIETWMTANDVTKEDLGFSGQGKRGNRGHGGRSFERTTTSTPLEQ